MRLIPVHGEVVNTISPRLMKKFPGGELRAREVLSKVKISYGTDGKHTVVQIASAHVGIASCSPKDIQNASIGLQIAANRAFQSIIDAHEKLKSGRIE